MPAAPDSPVISVVLVVVLAIAVLALVGVAVFIRRMRVRDQLTGVNRIAGAVSAAGILVSALVVSVALGSASVASADAPLPSPSSSVVTDGLQLPTLAE